MRRDETASLHLRSIGHRYRGGPWVVRDLDADWSFGRAVVVAGRNGTGKSTLLGIVAGVLRPRQGRVLGRPRAVAYVPERLSPPPIDAGAWLRSMAAIRGGRVLASRERLAALVGTVDERAAMGSLSKGTVRKVLLADALASPCRLLVLDEPWADLDDPSAAALTAALDERVADGSLVVVADHTGHAARLADDRVVVGPSVVDQAIRYVGPADRAAALDAVARSLGFRRTDP